MSDTLRFIVNSPEFGTVTWMPPSQLQKKIRAIDPAQRQDLLIEIESLTKMFYTQIMTSLNADTLSPMMLDLLWLSLRDSIDVSTAVKNANI